MNPDLTSDNAINWTAAYAPQAFRTEPEIPQDWLTEQKACVLPERYCEVYEGGLGI
jgi:hypothetical protein